eukprot:gene47665-58395_t
MSARAILLLAGILLLALFGVFGFFLHEAAPELTGLGFWGLVSGCVLFAFFFGFLIAAACGYMAGLVGSSSSPISGIGIIAVILVSLLILGMGSLESGLLQLAGGKVAIALALFTTAVVLAIAAISNDNLQDLKTGYLVGATPWRQQVALIVGCLAGALVIPPVLDLLYNAYGFAGALPREGMDPQQALAAPQATLISALAKGVIEGGLRWDLIAIGAVIGVAVILLDAVLGRATRGRMKLPPLAVGIGFYLPAAVTTMLVIGAVCGWLYDKAIKTTRFADVGRRMGVLLASGLIVGESLFLVMTAGVIVATGDDAPFARFFPVGETCPAMLSGIAVFA